MTVEVTSVAETIPPQISTDVARKEIPCNYCGSMQHEPFCPSNGRSLVRCQSCGLVYVSPRPDPDELVKLYGESYFHNNDSGTVGYSDYLKDERNIRQTFTRRLRFLERFVAPSRLLDVGCAVGFFLAEAQRRGWQVSGLDVSPFAVQYAQQQLALDVQQGSLLDLDYPAGSFDLLTMWDVIEHVPDPMGYIRRAADLLRSGGIFALATPDVDSLPARLTGKRWVGYKLSEEHVYYFSVRTLRTMLESAGFEIVNVRHVGKYVTMSLFLDRLGMYLPFVARFLQFFERTFHFSGKSAYINPFDIVAITARKC